MRTNRPSADDAELDHRRRIVHVSFGLDMGGQEKLLVELAKHVDRQRFSLHFISLGGRGRLAGDIEDLGWPVTALSVPRGLRPDLVIRLAHEFRCQRSDVVHTHDNRSLIYAGPAAPPGMRTPGCAYLSRNRHRRDTSTVASDSLGFRVREPLRLRLGRRRSREPRQRSLPESIVHYSQRNRR